MLPEDLAFFAGNVYAHWLYFNGLAEEKPASEKIQAVFCLNFGSMAEWKARMKRETAKLYGAGWIFVVADAVGALKITRTQNNDIPVGSPVLAIDLWEHAYLLEPGLDKEGYLDAVLSAIDWEEAEQRFCNAAR